MYPETPIGLYGVRPNQMMEAVLARGPEGQRHVNHMIDQLRNTILLDRVEWVQDLVAQKGKCPKCDFRQANYITPEVHLPYMNLLEDIPRYDELWPMSRMRLTAQNVHAMLQHWFENLRLENIDSLEQLVSTEETRKKKAKVTVFVDFN